MILFCLMKIYSTKFIYNIIDCNMRNEIHMCSKDSNITLNLFFSQIYNKNSFFDHALAHNFNDNFLVDKINFSNLFSRRRKNKLSVKLTNFHTNLYYKNSSVILELLKINYALAIFKICLLNKIYIICYTFLLFFCSLENKFAGFHLLQT